jgi:hypothetical protein
MKSTLVASNPVQAGYTEEDLRAYAHHIWIQEGMPCGSGPWDEARACLEANRPRKKSRSDQGVGHGHPAEGQWDREFV